MRRTDLDSSAEFSTFVELLRAKAAGQPDRLAFVFLADGESEEARLSYAQLDARARAVAAWLQTVTSRGDRVLLLYPPGLEYVAAFFGCLYAGAVAVPTYPPRGNGSLARLQTIVADAQATVALTTASLLSGLEAHLAREPALRLLDWMASDAIPATSANAWQEPAIAGDALALLQYTSGSAGTPKGVMVSHGNLLANERSIRHAFGHTDQTVGLGWLPLYHDMGLIGNVLQTAYLGTPCILMSPVAFLQKPIRWLQAIARYRATTSGGPSFAYELCVRATTPDQRAGLDLSCWKVAFNGAEPVRADTMKRFSEAFAPCGFRPEAFYPCYGLAEATLIVSGGLRGAPPVLKSVRSSLLQQHRVESASPGEADSQVLVGCGKALPDHNVVVAHSETLRRCCESEVGEILVAGPSVAQGYWNQPTTTAQTFQAYLADTGEGPFLRTGDLGFLHDGELFVTGRRTDLIIIRGRNYYPQDIEQTVQRCHPALGDCLGAAFSVEIDAEERIVVVHEVRRGYLRSLNVDEVVGAVRQAVFEEHGLQLEAVLLLKTSTISKTSSGKIQRHACRRYFLDGGLNVIGQWRQDRSRSQAPAADESVPAVEAAAVRTAERIQAWLIGRMAEQLGVAHQDINPRQPFACYGLDSVTAVKMAGSLQEWLGRPVEPTVVYDYPTAELLAHFLAGQAREADTAATAGRFAKEPIAVIGLGCRFPGADSPEAFWRLLHEGRSAITEMPPDRRDSGAVLAARPGQTLTPNHGQGGFLEGIDRFDPQFFGIAPREAESMDPQQRLLLEVSWEALEHAGIAPERTAGSRTGVFIGISSSDYSRRLFDLSHRIGAYAGTGGALSIAANRLSYVLDLHGPSWAVDAACSSSLVAVHQACGSLLQGECDMALAGAVNLILSPELTASFSQAGMLAADGRCKAFDASADGYVRSEGCGIVVLKLLSKALRDGDTILALIRGSAVNQDGRTNGLTAPHGPSQQAVVRLALSDAGVTAAELSYVEAHGTGTSLGDPIELNSLKQVLLEGRTAAEPCWIGSVKTNIGHLEAAAGIAGLIKVVLSLQHGEIAPHLHLKNLNPAIHLEGTPLSIPTKSQAWPSGDRVRLAGVNSFGFGGTNAHVVVAEPPLLPRRSSGAERPKHVWAFSAKSPAARLQLAQRYRDFLRQHPQIAFADACFTANTGRSHFSHRAAVVAASAAEAQEKLAALAAGRKTPGVVCGSVSGAATPKVAFLVGNVGCQAPGLGRQLDRMNPAFHEALARCEAILRPLLPQPLWAVLFPDPGGPCLREEPLYGPTTMFTIEYALAGLWESWGVKPSLIVARRPGRNVAACLAGVFGLEEGLRLAVLEGRLAEAQAQGGPTGGKAAESILGEMEQFLRRIHFSPPKIPIILADSGEFSEAEPATPDWWSRMAQATGRPETAKARLGALDANVFLELGPQSALLDVVGRSLSNEGRQWFAGLAEDRADWEQVLETLAQLYVCGAPIDWQTFDRPYSRVKVVLPTYPFERQRYWIEDLPADDLFYEVQWRPCPPHAPQTPSVELPSPAAILKPLATCLSKAQPAGKSAGSWLILADRQGTGKRLADAIRTRGGRCTVAMAAEEFAQVGDGPVHLPPHSVGHFQTVLNAAACGDPDGLRGVVHLWSLDAAGADALDASQLEAGWRLGCGSVRVLVQALAGAMLPAPPALWLVTRGAQAVGSGDELPGLAQSPLSGMAKVIGLEHPELSCVHVDLAPKSPERELNALLEEITTEDPHEDCVAWRGGQRYAPRLVRRSPPQSEAVVFRADGTYWITGGLGALGLRTASWMAERGAGHLVLTGRRGLPPRETWERLREETKIGKQTRVIRSLEAMGATVTIRPADISDPAQVADVVAEIASCHPPLRGIIHAAAVAGYQTVKGMDGESFDAVLRPKVVGAWLLAQHARRMPLDFFLCFSSISALWGAKGQGHYAAANAFLDTLAHFARRQGVAALSVNWGLWAGGGLLDEAFHAWVAQAGMETDDRQQRLDAFGGLTADGYRNWLAQSGVEAMESDEAFGALDRLLGGQRTQVTVARINWPRFARAWEIAGPRPLFEGLLSPSQHRQAPSVPPADQPFELRRRLEAAPVEKRHLILVSYFKQQIAEVLGLSVSQIDIQKPLSHMGLDSMMAIELKSRIKTESGVDLSMVNFMESAGIAGLAAILEEQLAAAPRAWGPETPPMGPRFVSGQLPPATTHAYWIEGEL